MDDRVAKALLEDNIVVRQKRAEADIALLQKLATNPSVVLEELPIPGETEPPASNALHWQNIFLFDEFASIGKADGIAGGDQITGALGWYTTTDVTITLSGVAVVSPGKHYGVIGIQNAAGTDAYLYLNKLLSTTFALIQFICGTEAMVDAGDGCIYGLVEISAFQIDGSSKGIYFRREYTETNWHAVTTDGVGTTDTDTGVAFFDAVWYFLEIKQPTTGIIEFWINQILVATHTTNIETTDGLHPLIGMKDPGSTSAISVGCDYFAMQLATMIQRWD